VDELTFMLASILLAVTVVSSSLYYRRLRRAQREYELAHTVVGDMVSSFSRQFKREDEKIESVAYKMESLASKVESSLGMGLDISRKVDEVRSRVDSASNVELRVTGRIVDVERKLNDLVASQEGLVARISGLEQHSLQVPNTPDLSLQGVIPIRKEKALSQLTETEVSVLEMLVSEGPKTAPAIKERVNLSREHTARLMKKLYEDGYLERETGRLPFRYSVKKEMEKLLRKADGQTPQAG
jgi:predicted transcriptional regulator